MAYTNAPESSTIGQVLQNIKGLDRAFDEFMYFDTATPAAPKNLGITGFGDSMCGYLGRWLLMDLSKKYGVGALYTPEFGISWNGASATLSGGAAAVTNDFTHMPSACEINIPVGGKYAITTPSIATSGGQAATWIGAGDLTNARYSSTDNEIPLPLGFTSVRIFYVKSTGAGSITGTLIQSQYSNVTATASADASEALGVMDLTVTDALAPITLEITSATAAIRFIGAAFFTGTGGVSYWASAKGSTKMDDQLPGLSGPGNTWNPVYASLVTSLSTPFVFHIQRASDTGDEADHYQADYRLFFSAYSALVLSQVVFEEPMRDVENPLTTNVINAFLMSESKIRGLAFFQTKAIVDPVVATAIGWSIGDIHLEYRFWRFASGRFLNEVNYFTNSFSKYSPANTTLSIADRQKNQLLPLSSQVSILGQNGVTLDGGTQSTYSAMSVDTERGFKAASTAALGNTAARIGIFQGGGSQITTNLGSVSITGIGYRNINMPSGTESFLVFGGNATTMTALPGSSTRWFGLQFAYGSDIGGLSSATQEFVRLAWSDGSSQYYSRWIPCSTAGGVVSGSGSRFLLTWDFSSQRLTLSFNAVQNKLFPRISVVASPLASNATSGAWTHMCLKAANTDWGNGAGPSPTPVATGLFQWKELNCQFDV